MLKFLVKKFKINQKGVIWSSKWTNKLTKKKEGLFLVKSRWILEKYK